MGIASVRFWTLAAFVFAASASIGSADEIHDAAIDGDLERVRELLDQGVSVDAADDSGTPLQWALFGNQTGVVRLLLENGANPNVQGAGGSPLIQASTNGDIEAIRLLLEHGADPNAGEDRTPLTVAAQMGDLEVTELLLVSGADPTIATIDGVTALHEAAEGGHLEVAKSLAARGADVNALTSSGRPPIHYAIATGNEELARFLRDNGAAPGPIEPVAERLGSADAESGEVVAEVCLKCHPVDPLTTGFVGPHLWDVVGRLRGGLDGYKYSSAMASLEGDWSFEALNRFIARPTEVVPGTKMDFAGLPGPDERADLLIFLRTLSDAPAPIP